MSSGWGAAKQIREALNSLNFVQVQVKKKKFLIKTKSSVLAHDIWRLLRLKPPRNVTPAEEMEVSIKKEEL